MTPPKMSLRKKRKLLKRKLLKLLKLPKRKKPLMMKILMMKIQPIQKKLLKLQMIPDLLLIPFLPPPHHQVCLRHHLWTPLPHLQVCLRHHLLRLAWIHFFPLQLHLK